MPFTYEFIDNGKSLGINFNDQGYTAGKNLVELTIPDLAENNVLKIRTNSARPTEFDINIGVDTILGVGAGSTTATELRDALELIFFLDDNGGGGGSVDWGDIEGDINTNPDLPFTQTQSLVTFDRDVQFPNQSVFLGGGKSLGSTNELLVATNVNNGNSFNYLPEVVVENKLSKGLCYVDAYEAFDKNSPQGQAQPSQTTTILSQPFIEDITGTTKHFISVIIPSALGDIITYNWYLRSSTGFVNGYLKAFKSINLNPNSTDYVWSTATINDVKSFSGQPSSAENVLINESPSVNADIQIPLLRDGFFQKNGETLTFLLVCDNAFEVEAGDLPDGQGGTFTYPYIIVDGVKWREIQTADIDPSTGKIPIDLIPSTVEGGLKVVGYWDADTNTPDLSTITLEQGEAYQVSVAGNTSLNGYDEWNEFDLAVWIDTVAGNWFRIVSTEKVLSVNGRKGNVVINKTDLGLGNVDNTSDLNKPISTDTQTALDNKVDVGGDITDLNNNAGYINTVLVDGTTVTGDGVNTPLSSIGSGGGQSFLIKTNVLDNILVNATVNNGFEPLNCIGGVEFSEGSVWNLDSQGVEVPEDGVYNVSLGIVFDSTGQRPTPVVSLSVDGVLVGDESGNAYIRGSGSAINSASCNLSTSINLTAGQKVGLQVRREGGVTAALRTVSTGSFLTLEKASSPVESIGVSSLDDLSDVSFDVPPQINQVLKYNGNVFTAADESGGGGGSVEVIDKEVNITQGSWNGNTNYVYANIPVTGVEVGQLCIIYPNPIIWQTIQANAATWDGYAYCLSDGLVNAVCRVSSFIGIPPLSTFHIKIIESVSSFQALSSYNYNTQDIDVVQSVLTVNELDHDKYFNIVSDSNYNVVLPDLDLVDVKYIYKFKNLKNSFVRGVFTPLTGQLIEGNNDFKLYGKGYLTIKKKVVNGVSSWSITDVSSLFDHLGHGRTKEVQFTDHMGIYEVVHNLGYKPIVEIDTADGFGGFSESDVDIDHNDNNNSFIVNMEGLNSGFIRYV